MKLEGVIEEVMESWPLQLVVRAADGRWNVRLLTSTSVSEGGQDRGPDLVKRGARVEMSGRMDQAPRSFVAESIVVVG